MIEIGTTVKRTYHDRETQNSGVILELQPMNKCDVLWSNGTISQECLEYLVPVMEKQLSFEQPDKIVEIELARAEKLKKEVAVARAMYLPEKKMVEVMVKKGYSEDEIKTALYWKDKGRCYKPNTAELENNEYLCPRCKAPMRHVRYRRQQPTWGCPECFFIIKDRSILTPKNIIKEYAKKKAFKKEVK